MSRFTSVTVQVDSHNVGLLTLNRPSKSNSIDRTLWEELPAALEDLVANGARCVSGA
jgi:enoyl-CoA hydratase/carnithine racemase